MEPPAFIADLLLRFQFDKQSLDIPHSLAHQADHPVLRFRRAAYQKRCRLFQADGVGFKFVVDLSASIIAFLHFPRPFQGGIQKSL